MCWVSRAKSSAEMQAPSNPNPLFDPHQMWRGIQPCVQAGRSQDRFHESCDRSFPVGSCDQDRVIVPVRIPEGFKQSGDIVQAEFGGENLVAKGVKISESVCVLHEKQNPPSLAWTQAKPGG